MPSLRPLMHPGRIGPCEESRRSLPTGYRLLVLLPLFAFLVISTLAQTTPDLENGMKPYGSFQSGSIDSVSLTNGNLAINVPFWSLPQRGGKLHVGLSLYYAGNNFYAQKTCTRYGVNNNCEIYTTRVYPNALGVGLDSPERVGIHATWVDSEQQDTQGNEIYMPSYSVVTSDGAMHQLGVSTTSHTSFETIDGTGFHYDSSTGYITSPNGIRSYVGPETFQYCAQNPTSNSCTSVDPFSVTWASSWEDSNGNKVNLTSYVYTDTLGRAIPSSTATTSTSNCPQLSYPYQTLSLATVEYLPAPGVSCPQTLRTRSYDALLPTEPVLVCNRLLG